MGGFQLIASLWPFLKEMFSGEKINDPNSTRQGPSERTRTANGNYAVLAARWMMSTMQNSRKFLATVVSILLLSLFVNYKVISKMSAIPTPRDDEHLQQSIPDPRGSKEVPTIPIVPSKDKTEKEILFEQTRKELKHLYGEQE